MHEYDLDIVHRVGKVNQGVDRLSWNSSFNEKDTMGACWHGDVNFKAIIGWHAFAYVCSLLGCFGVVPQINMNAKVFHDASIEWCPKRI